MVALQYETIKGFALRAKKLVRNAPAQLRRRVREIRALEAHEKRELALCAVLGFETSFLLASRII